MTTWSQFYLTVAKQITNLSPKNQVLCRLKHCISIAIVINQSLNPVTNENHKWFMIVTGNSLTW